MHSSSLSSIHLVLLGFTGKNDMIGLLCLVLESSFFENLRGIRTKSYFHSKLILNTNLTVFILSDNSVV